MKKLSATENFRGDAPPPLWTPLLYIYLYFHKANVLLIDFVYIVKVDYKLIKKYIAKLITKF